MKKKQKDCFKNFHFIIHSLQKPCIKHLKNIDLLNELPFHNELSIKQIWKAFKRYAKSYKIEIIDSKDPLAQLETSKSSTKDLFEDLDEIKGFKYQITESFVKKTQRERRHRICYCLF